MKFCVVKGVTKYIVMAKKEPFTSNHPHPIYEPGEIYFEFRDTEEEALDNLKKSLTAGDGVVSENKIMKNRTPSQKIDLYLKAIRVMIILLAIIYGIQIILSLWSLT